ncbi:hypothetical protein Nepgr_026057 [Nepenthes gracilis]|uniref:Uncharacterized protein n=1 Tax=Nepenthes gracilis TaxID=150966 RepID=A0AAD3T852_NEPGR|nr:hypothetical protein Nepgr_026057 [Nepenthes gracilis]
MHPHQHQETGKHSSPSPSFSSYTSNKLAEIAARVIDGFANEGSGSSANEDGEAHQQNIEGADSVNDGGDFEFYLSTDVLTNSQIYPLFDLDLLKNFETKPSESHGESRSRTVQLKDLFIEDPETACFSSTSSELDELEGVPAGSYCLWTPRSPSRYKKSNSTGSTAPNPWRLRDLLLLRRSRSDGEQALVLFTPSRKKGEERTDQVPPRPKPKVAARERSYYGMNSRKGDDKIRRSYLPYRQDLVGLFAASPQRLRTVRFPPF